MRRFLIGTILAVLIVLCTAGSASAERGCVLNILGIKVCGELLTPLPTVTVTVKPPPVRVTTIIPGPTHTVTIPGAPVTLSGPTATVTKTAAPLPGPTIGPGVPQSTITKTETVSPSGQPSPTRGTLGPGDTAEHEPFFNLESPGGVSRTVGIGLLSLLALVAIILAGMGWAFNEGRQSAFKEDTNFMREVLDRVKSRGKHS